MKFHVFVLFMLLSGSYGLPSFNESCTMMYGPSGKITDKMNVGTEERCWIIEVEEDSQLKIKLNIEFESSTHNGFEIIEIETGETHTFPNSRNAVYKVFNSSVKIVHFARNGGTWWWSNLHFAYKIVTGISAVEGIEDTLKSGIAWIKKQRTMLWGWKEDTPRAVVALYLADAAKFTGTDMEEELMAKETDVRSSISLLRSSLTTNELSLIVNALLVTCHNPHHFYGKNIVRQLKTAVESTKNLTHPIAYLALCNANEAWPPKALRELNRVLGHKSNYAFIKEIQAVAVMALSCMMKRDENFLGNSSTLLKYEYAIQNLKDSQLRDGSFGNAHSTAFVVQAMIASGQERVKDWNMKEAIKYLMTALNSSSVDFLTAYLTLPILNSKSLADISEVDCSSSLRKQGDDTISEIHDTLGVKIRVKYSLYFGDNKDIIHTISLKVPKGVTAYEVMEQAALADPTYKFEAKNMYGKIYVYKIANVTNDSENGKFWLQYVSNPGQVLESVIKGPNELVLKDEQHLIMWYKTMHI